MSQLRVVLALATLLAPGFWAGMASAQQALPTAAEALQLSGFGGVSGSYTGLSGGRNLSITVGADLALPPVLGRIRPALEVRGTYPFERGSVDSQKNILGGLRVSYLLNQRIRPYGDFLFGRGQINYGNGYTFGGETFALTTTNVYSYGGGFVYDLTEHFSLKADGQIQHWGYAPTPSGSIYSKIGTVGVVYRFDFNRRHKQR